MVYTICTEYACRTLPHNVVIADGVYSWIHFYTNYSIK